MIHQYRNKIQTSKRKKSLKVILMIVVLVIAILFILSFFSDKFSNYIGWPIWQAKKVSIETTQNLGYLTKSKSEIYKDNENLKQENSKLKISMIDYQILKEENDKLKEILGSKPENYKVVLSNILVKPSSSPYDTLIIDSGNDKKITVGSTVYVNGNIPVGEVSKVYNRTSLVELYSNPGKITRAIIEGSNVSVDLVGRGGGNFEMSVPLELDIQKGEKILLPGQQPEIVAVVEEDISDPTDPIKTVILRSPVNIQNQKWVQVKLN